MPIEDDEGARRCHRLQIAIDALPTADKAKRLEILGNMHLILTRLQIMVDDEISELRGR